MPKKISRRYHYVTPTAIDQERRMGYSPCDAISKPSAPLMSLYHRDLARNTSTPHRPRMKTYLLLKSLLSPLTSIQFSHIFIYLLFLSSASFGLSRRCDVDKCGNHYRSIAQKDDPSEKCRLLSLHSECLSKRHMACRGNLLYHTSVLINEKAAASMDCAQSSSNSVHSTNHGTSKTNQCTYAGKPEFKFCSLFGDPHVRTFSDKFHTCKANGSWKLVNNDYLLVKAINSQLPGKLRATAITKLVVVIRGSGECAKKKIYRAEIGHQLPAQFNDGSTHTGTNQSVNVTVKDLGKEVQIDIRFIATTMVIRHVGSHLSFSIQMPEEMVDSNNRGEQMCVRGCPRRQRIPINKKIKRLTTGSEGSIATIKKYSEYEARRKCKDALLREYEIESNVTYAREKRSASQSSKRSREKKAVDLSASATSWKLLLDSPRESARSRAPSRSRKNRNRQRNVPAKRRENDLELFLHDDPGVGRRRDRGKAVVSSVTRGTNFYFDACVFDLMTTGDVTYASSARGAFDDVTRFHRSGSKAKGASKNAIASWTSEEATSEPPTTSIKRVIAEITESIHETTSGAQGVVTQFSALLFFVTSTTCLLNDVFCGTLIVTISFFNFNLLGG